MAGALEIPVKFRDQQLAIPENIKSRFSAQDIETGNFVEAKYQESQICRRGSSLSKVTRMAAPNEQLEDFVESQNLVLRLEQMEIQKVTKGSSKKQPWSGDYWAYARGLIGARISDRDFDELEDWISRFQYILLKSAQSLLQSSGSKAIEKLSSSEKYDLLIGDDRGLLTSSMWMQGKEYYDQYGNVEQWMGICHGWAPAAIMEQRPTRLVQIPSYNNSEWQIPFSPAEIKGLVSYSWATNTYSAKTLGHRCNKKKPERDENGRIIDTDCFDLNPATWHLIVVNRLGMQRNSFVMDATYDYEVWNQPILSYEYEYFNPQTGDKVDDLNSATVLREDFSKDLFSKYRSASAKKIVGIKMKVSYVAETPAVYAEHDSESNDQIYWVEYRYDLELDKKNNIIGGEWYQAAHPDFIWTPKQGVQPQSLFDVQLASSTWDENSKLPADWAKAAQKGATKGDVLNKITHDLVNKSATSK
jgi:hypothetical protein